SCSASRSRRRFPSASSAYSAAAAAGETRCSTSPRTTTRYSNGPRRIRRRSPTPSGFARLARSPLSSTWPAPTAAAASARVLKKRAAHSQRSSRTRVGCVTRDPPASSTRGAARAYTPYPRSSTTPVPQSRMPARMPPHQPDVLPHRRTSRAFRLETLAALSAGLLAACGTPGVRGVAGTAPAPNVFWTPPPARRAEAPAAALLPPDVAGRVAQLKLADVIDIALRNNAATGAAWADARAAAASYGAAQGQYYPALSLDGTVTAIKTVPSAGRLATKQQFLNPTLNLSWLLFDFGGRSGSVGAARDAL